MFKANKKVMKVEGIGPLGVSVEDSCITTFAINKNLLKVSNADNIRNLLKIDNKGIFKTPYLKS